tara:strand:- start:54 stop:515 length:462 start_codon:yes stop_codon:yes gene_type:complete
MSSSDTYANCVLVALFLGGLYYAMISARKGTREGLTGSKAPAAKDPYGGAQSALRARVSKLCSDQSPEGMGLPKNKAAIKSLLTEAQKDLDGLFLFETLLALEKLGNGDLNDDALKSAVGTLDAVDKLKGFAASSAKALDSGVCAASGKSSFS